MADAIPIALIERGIRIRQIDERTVAGLIASINEVGLLHPITVRPHVVVTNGCAGDGYILVGGLHRLEAMTRRRATHIPAVVVEMDGLLATIAECDENLCGSNLSAAERALFTRRRKDAYEALHPETRNGENQHTRVRQVGEPSDRFTADAAAKTGKPERTIQRDAERGESIPESVLQQIAGTDLDKGVVLDRLKKSDDAVAELDTIRAEQAAAKETKKAKRETKPVKPAPGPLNDVETEEKWMTSIMAVWNRGSAQWRERFLETVDTPVFDRTNAA